MFWGSLIRSIVIRTLRNRVSKGLGKKIGVYVRLRWLLLRYDISTGALRVGTTVLLVLWGFLCLFGGFLFLGLALSAGLNAYWQSVYAGYLATGGIFILLILPMLWAWRVVNKRIGKWVLKALLRDKEWAEREQIEQLLTSKQQDEQDESDAS